MLNDYNRFFIFLVLEIFLCKVTATNLNINFKSKIKYFVPYAYIYLDYLFKQIKIDTNFLHTNILFM